MPWNAPRVGLVLAALLASGPAANCLAGDGYLDRSKVQEAIPYGTTIEPPPSHDAGAVGKDDDAPRTAPPSGSTSTTVDAEPAERRRGGDGSPPR